MCPLARNVAPTIDLSLHPTEGLLNDKIDGVPSFPDIDKKRGIYDTVIIRPKSIENAKLRLSEILNIA